MTIFGQDEQINELENGTEVEPETSDVNDSEIDVVKESSKIKLQASRMLSKFPELKF